MIGLPLLDRFSRFHKVKTKSSKRDELLFFVCLSTEREGAENAIDLPWNPVSASPSACPEFSRNAAGIGAPMKPQVHLINVSFHVDEASNLLWEKGEEKRSCIFSLRKSFEKYIRHVSDHEVNQELHVERVDKAETKGTKQAAAEETSNEHWLCNEDFFCLPLL